MLRVCTKILGSAVVICLAGGSMAYAAGHLAEDDGVQDLQPYYLQENLNLANYNQVILDSLTVSDARVVPPPWVVGGARNPEKWQLTATDVQWLRESYRSAMRTVISGDSGYDIVTKSGAGVLIVDVEIVALMPYARKDEAVTTRGFGEILVQAQFRDGDTQQLLAVFEGWQDVGSEYQQNSRLNSERDLQDLFIVWGKRVRRILDEAHGQS